MALDESRMLGCVYIDPPEQAGVDAEVWYWARSSELARGFEDDLARFVRAWLRASWPFRSVILCGERVALRD